MTRRIAVGAGRVGIAATLAVCGCAAKHAEQTDRAETGSGSEGTTTAVPGPDDSGSSDADTATTESEDDGTSTGAGPTFAPPREVWRTSSTWGSVTAVCVDADDGIAVVGSRANSIDHGAAYVLALSGDGRLAWRTEIGTSLSATYFYDVACAPDGSIYAVGSTGEEVQWSARPLVARLDAATGELLSSSVLGDEAQEGWVYGIAADDEGVYLAGAAGSASEGDAPYLAHYFPDGSEDWTYNATIDDDWGSLYAVERVGDTIFAVGEAKDGYHELAWLVGFDLAGQPLGSERFHWADSQGWFVARDPAGDGVLMAGTLDQSGNGATWVQPCTTRGCIDEPLELDGTASDLHGFAVDRSGLWLGAEEGEIAARIPGGELAWRHDTGLSQTFFYGRKSVLALDSTGAIVIGGEDDGHPTLVKLVRDDG